MQKLHKGVLAISVYTNFPSSRSDFMRDTARTSMEAGRSVTRGRGPRQWRTSVTWGRQRIADSRGENNGGKQAHSGPPFGNCGCILW